MIRILDIGRILGQFLEFRSAADTSSLFFQAILFGVSVVVTVGMLYILMVALVVVVGHHIVCDRDADVIPSFVLTTMPMEASSSSSDDNDLDFHEIQTTDFRRRRSKRVREGSLSVGPTRSTKTFLLEKFMQEENEVKSARLGTTFKNVYPKGVFYTGGIPSSCAVTHHNEWEQEDLLLQLHGGIVTIRRKESQEESQVTSLSRRRRIS